MINVQLLLFDLDGTLIDSRADLARSINLMLADLDRPLLPEATVAGFVGDGVKVLVRRSLNAVDQRLPDEQLHRQAVELMHHHYAEQMFVSTSLYPGVAETLRHYHDKLKAVVTSKEVGFTRLILEKLGIADCFNSIIGGDSVDARKPDPLPVIEALKRLGGWPENAVMIGDTENDILAGQKAGTRTCAVSYGFRTTEQLIAAAPDIVVHSFDELKIYID